MFFFLFLRFILDAFNKTNPTFREYKKNALMQNNESKHASLTNEYHTVP